jgi:putative FmdB family regulatory protein
LTEEKIFCNGLSKAYRSMTMPIYEFYCKKCNTIFNFFSNSINTEKKPNCPNCVKPKLERQMSAFSTLKNRGENDDQAGMPDLDESKMEQAMSLLAKESERLDENDPKQAANLMRKLSDIAGVNLGPQMEEALARMEAGEDPEQIEADMGDLLEGEDPFDFKKKAGSLLKKAPPKVDDKLYYL